MNEQICNRSCGLAFTRFQDKRFDKMLLLRYIQCKVMWDFVYMLNCTLRATMEWEWILNFEYWIF